MHNHISSSIQDLNRVLFNQGVILKANLRVRPFQRLDAEAEVYIDDATGEAKLLLVGVHACALLQLSPE